MIRHQVKIQDDPMLNALETGKRRAKRSLSFTASRKVWRWWIGQILAR
jgi:hypothetical protein